MAQNITCDWCGDPCPDWPHGGAQLEVYGCPSDGRHRVLGNYHPGCFVEVAGQIEMIHDAHAELVDLTEG